jgi:hypothetical protein
MIRFEPEAWYEEFQLREMGIPEEALVEARESGQLRSKQLKRGATWYKGAWLIEWMEKTPEVSRK